MFANNNHTYTHTQKRLTAASSNCRGKKTQQLPPFKHRFFLEGKTIVNASSVSVPYWMSYSEIFTKYEKIMENFDPQGIITKIIN